MFLHSTTTLIDIPLILQIHRGWRTTLTMQVMIIMQVMITINFLGTMTESGMRRFTLYSQRNSRASIIQPCSVTSLSYKQTPKTK